MTAPIPGGSLATQAIPDLVGVGVQELLSSAARLGLTWGMSLATVNNTTPLTATIDGDTASIGMVSMVNGSLGVGSRVYVISVPPSGNFIVGQVNGGVPYRDQIVTTSTVASVVFTNIPDNLRSVTLRSVARANTNGAFALYLRINGDATAAAYNSHKLGATDATYITPITQVGTLAAMDVGVVCGNNNADEYSSTEVNLMGWNQSASDLVAVFQSTALVVGIGFFTRSGGCSYASSPPYTSITVFPSSGSFESGCIFTLVGDPI